MSNYENMQNIQEPLDRHFRAVENQGKWVKNQGNIRKIDLSCLADTLLELFFFEMNTEFQNVN